MFQIAASGMDTSCLIIFDTFNQLLSNTFILLSFNIFSKDINEVLVQKLEEEQQMKRMTKHMNIERYQLLLHVRRRQQ